jgi:hypothetical protein
VDSLALRDFIALGGLGVPVGVAAVGLVGRSGRRPPKFLLCMVGAAVAVALIALLSTLHSPADTDHPRTAAVVAVAVVIALVSSAVVAALVFVFGRAIVVTLTTSRGGQ